MPDNTYKNLIDQYLDNHITVDQFIDSYFNQWRNDRDHEISYDPKFLRIINRIFASCDCYAEDPQKDLYEISETELRDEINLLRHIWWG